MYDPAPGYDFCYTPENLRLHGALSFDFTRETILRPIFQLSKFARNPEFLTTPLQAYENVTSEAARKKTMKWEDKTVDKLFWRGSSTGDSYAKKKNGDWRRSHRPRLHLMAQNGQGSDEVYVQRGRQWERESWEKGKLNEVYLDVGLTGKPHQVSVVLAVRAILIRSSARRTMGLAMKWRRKSSSKTGSLRSSHQDTNVRGINSPMW